MAQQRLAYLLALVFSLAGIGLSTYLMDESSVLGTSFCEIGSAFSCTAVLQSTYSKFLGLSIAFYGLVWFVASATLSLASLKRHIARRMLLYWGALGLAGIAVLNYVEFFVIGAFCLYCSIAHVLGVGVFAMAYIGIGMQ